MYLCSENKGADQLHGYFCTFVFTYAKSRFSYDVVQLVLTFWIHVLES